MNSMAVRELCIDSAGAGQRIDNFLLGYFKGVPRSRVYRMLRKGEVRINRGRIKADYRLRAGDRVRIPPVRQAPPRATARPPAGQLERLERAVIFEDERLLVLNKPSGLAVHGGSGLSFGAIEALRIVRPHERHLELVHRLDRDTSGCLLVSKKRSLLRALHELLRRNQVDKRYLMLLAGPWGRGRVTEVKAPLRKSTLQGGGRMVRVDPTGKTAHTRFQRLRCFSDATLAEARLFTGRTHQIRVHAAHLGNPVLGDAKYGDAAANRRARELGLRRLFLHAAALTFLLPGDDEPFRVRAPLSPDLENVIENLVSSQ